MSIEYNSDPNSAEQKILNKKARKGKDSLSELHNIVDPELKELSQKIIDRTATEKEKERYNLLINQWIGPDENEINTN